MQLRLRIVFYHSLVALVNGWQQPLEIRALTQPILPSTLAFDMSTGCTPSTTDSGRQTQPYKSAARVADVLRCLANDVNSVGEIARYCGVSNSAASRLLGALADSGLIAQDPVTRRCYYGGLIASLVSQPFAVHKSLMLSAHDQLVRLRDLSGETVFLSVLLGMQYMNLSQMAGGQEVSIIQSGKMQSPLFRGATAKALLSQISAKDLLHTMKYCEMYESSQSIPFDKTSFMAQMSDIQRLGYVITCGESIPHLLGIAAPIRHYSVPASLSLIGFVDDLAPKIDGLIDDIKLSAGLVSDMVVKFLNIT